MINGDQTDLQSLKEGQARIERDFRDLSNKLDGYLLLHQQKHDADQATFNSYVLRSSETGALTARHELQIPELTKRVDSTEAWRHELAGAMNLLKLAFGTSIISSVIAVVALVTLFTSS